MRIESGARNRHQVQRTALRVCECRSESREDTCVRMSEALDEMARNMLLQKLSVVASERRGTNA